MNPWEMNWDKPDPSPNPWEMKWGQGPQEDFMRGPEGVAKDTNALQSLAIGAGRGMEKVGAGIAQPFLEAWTTLGIPGAQGLRDDLATQQKEAERLYAPLAKEHPFATGLGEATPAFAIPVGGAASVLGAAAAMAVPGAAQALLSYGSPEERLKDAAVQGAGGALGGGLLSAAGKIVSPAVGAAKQAADPLLAKLSRTAKDIGIQLTPAQSGGGQVARAIEAGLQTIPWTMGGQQAIKDTQQQAFNKAILSKAVGMDADKATPDVLGDAAAKIGSKFEQGYTGATIPVDNMVRTTVDAIENKYAQRLDTMQKPIVANIAADLRAAGDTLTGEQYHSIVSDIATAARDIKDKPTQGALKNLRAVLDTSFRGSVPKEQADLYFEARGQWKNLLSLEDAMKNARSQGDIPAKQLYASVQKNTPNFVRGQGGELGDVVRMGREFLPDPTPNSGTPLRSLMANVLTAGGLGGGGATLSTVSGGDPMDGLKAGLAAYVASKGAQKLYNSRYPTNQLLTDELKQIISRGGGLFGTGAAIGALGSR